MSLPVTASRPARRTEWIGKAAKFSLGLAISAAFLYATLSSVPLDRLLAALAHANGTWLCIALVFIGIDFTLKIYRWRTMLHELGAPVSTAQAAIPFMGCVALNNILPFRAGDVIRVVAFRALTRLSTSAQLSTLILERLLDVATLLALLFATLSIGQIDVLPPPLLRAFEAAAALIVGALAAFLAAPGVFTWLSRRAEALWPILRPLVGAVLRLSLAVSSLSRPGLLGRLAALSVLAWLAEAGAYLAVGHALGIGSNVEVAITALAVGTLSTLIPSSPGYIGTFHYFTAITVAAFGVAEADSTAYAVVIHGILWASTTLCGLIMLSTTSLGAALRPMAGQQPSSSARSHRERNRPTS
jgi:glycosyltransferase 2 family protein